MIAYFDTSAVVPLLVDEATSSDAGRLWAAATRVASVRLVYPETRAALAQGQRMGRLTAKQLRLAVAELDTRVAQIDLVELDASLAHDAGSLAETYGLRGYDSVHLAAALRLNSGELVLVAGDNALLAAADSAGLATAVLRA